MSRAAFFAAKFTLDTANIIGRGKITVFRISTQLGAARKKKPPNATITGDFRQPLCGGYKKSASASERSDSGENEPRCMVAFFSGSWSAHCFKGKLPPSFGGGGFGWVGKDKTADRRMRPKPHVCRPAMPRQAERAFDNTPYVNGGFRRALLT